ncbi:MAG TPA: surface-adhesin E family protein [Gallionella sp.]|nr:surface-adhesin E family protein [Gallionella sp.]
MIGTSFFAAMRKTIFLLLVVNGTAIADEWVEVNRNVYAAGYANPASIVRDGNFAIMWTLVDCKAMTHFIGGYPFMSIKSHEEFDCKERKLRTLVYSLHPGKMGEGKVIFSDSNPSQWAPVLPDSEMVDFLNIACGRK